MLRVTFSTRQNNEFTLIHRMVNWSTELYCRLRLQVYHFYVVLAIAILSVCQSVYHTGGSVKNGAS